MNAKELAAQLNGIQYPVERTPKIRQIFEQATIDGLVIVYGASDDLMEFRGAIVDEIGAREGTTVLVDGEGLLPDITDEDDHDELERYFKRKSNAHAIHAHWCDDDLSGTQEADVFTWTYRTEIPHETFTIMDGEERYCRGIVFALKDAVAPNTLKVQELHLTPGKLEGTLEGGVAGALAQAFHEQFSDSEAANYLEMTFDPKGGSRLIVTIQKADGMTPGAKVSKIKELVRAGKIDEALAI